MFLPGVFREDRPEIQYQLMREHCLGALTAVTDDGIEVDHLPFLIPQPYDKIPVLQTHVSRRNTIWERLNPDREVVVVFQGPEHYISPTWYPGSKTHGKVAPSWNYMVVHAYGMVRVQENQDWLMRHLHELTEQQEAQRSGPWKMTDSPEGYAEHLSQQVVGIEISVSRMPGKWQVSQHRSIPDRMGVINGLRAENSSSALTIADLIQENLPDSID